MAEKRDVEYKFRLTKRESENLEKRFEKSELKSMSTFLRQQVVNGIYLEFSPDELAKIRKSVQASANNINQIAVRVNSTNRIYKDDMQSLKESINEIWQQLRYIQSVLQKLSQYGM
jgi:chromatin segregation and condensation protein Rec8/ScpA/Scc1 (kleisin family)